MEKNKFKKNANNVMWVEYWIQKAHPSCEEYEIHAEKLTDGRWECKIELPLINKMVTSVARTEVNAMLNASRKASELIDEYMKDHKELMIENVFKRKPYLIECDENGRYQGIAIDIEYRKKENKKMMWKISESTKTMQRAIARVKKITGLDKGLFIQVIDKKTLGKKLTIDDVSRVVSHNLQKDYGSKTLNYNLIIDGESVIYIGCTLTE